MTATITLHVPSVRCRDESGGSWKEEFGNDEIYLGAVFVSISANKSFDVITAGAQVVGDNFDDGETVNWGRDLFTHDLGDPSVYPYPKAGVASLVLAEHDSGNGRNNFLERLAQDFRNQLTPGAIEAAIDRAASVARAEGLTAADKDPKDDPSWVVKSLQEYAGKKLAEIGDYLIKTAEGWAGDEIFPVVLKVIDIPTPSHTWNGQGDTPEETVEFFGHEGIYSVSLKWKLRATLVWTDPGPILGI